MSPTRLDTAKLMEEMSSDCTSCGECVRVCSFLQQHGSPATTGFGGISEDNLKSAFECSLCGLCDAVCPEVLSPSKMMLAMRQEAAHRKAVDMQQFRPWLNYEKLGTSFLFSRYIIPDGCKTVFFPGCSLPGTRPEAVINMFAMIRKTEPSAGLVLDCCGKISHDLGMVERFDDIFLKIASRLSASGIVRIITSCPGCSKIIKKYGNRFETASVYELLADAVNVEPSCKISGSRTVVIHDPCPARFDNEQQQAVRKLAVAAGYTVEELPSNRNKTRCCGQGGMVEGCLPGTVKKESSKIADEAKGRLVASSCAACVDSIGNVTDSLHIYDLLHSDPVPAEPVSSASRWLNRLKLKFARII